MTAVAGDDTAMWKDKIGFFAPGGVMANDEGMAALAGTTSIAESRKALADAGYKGEKVLLMAPSDFPAINAMSEVAADMFRKLGMNLDYQAMDWGSMLTPHGQPQSAGQGRLQRLLHLLRRRDAVEPVGA